MAVFSAKERVFTEPPSAFISLLYNFNFGGLLKLRAAGEFFINCFMRAARDFDRQLH
jgi:hypothetical protein